MTAGNRKPSGTGDPLTDFRKWPYTRFSFRCYEYAAWMEVLEGNGKMVIILPKQQAGAQLEQRSPAAGRARIIPIESKARTPNPRRPEPKRGMITQDRLQKGLQLHLEELRVTRELREFRMELERDLMAGAKLGSGDLFFDAELKIVRHKVAAVRPAR